MEGNTIQNQPRVSALTDGEILDQVSVDDICENEAEIKAIDEYKNLYNILALEGRTHYDIQRLMDLFPEESDEFKFYQKCSKHINKHANALNEDLRTIRCNSIAKHPLERARKIWDEQERERSKKLLEEYRKKKELELEKSIKQKEEIRIKHATILSNYKKIDQALSHEKDLRDQCLKDLSRAENDANKEIQKTIQFVCIAWVIGTIIFALSFYDLFPSDSFFPHLIIAIFIATLIAISYIANDIQNIKQRLFELKNKYKNETEKEIIKMYHLLFNGADLYEFLGVPNHIILESYKNFPLKKNDEDKRQFGIYTRYISPCGTKYHVNYGCSTATIPKHLFSIYQRETCARCAINDKFTPPDWYLYLQKLQPVISKYPFLFDLSIKPYD